MGQCNLRRELIADNPDGRGTSGNHHRTRPDGLSTRRTSKSPESPGTHEGGMKKAVTY